MIIFLVFIAGIYLLIRNEQVFKARNRIVDKMFKDSDKRDRIVDEMFKNPDKRLSYVRDRYEAMSYHKMVFSLKSVKKLEKEIMGEK